MRRHERAEGTESSQKKKDAVISAEGLSFTYEGGERKALDGVTFSIERGQRIAFIGANGSGKSTLFLCMNGILRPDEGEIMLSGEPVSYTRKGLKQLRSSVGIVFQDPDTQLFLADVREEISFGILNQEVPDEGEIMLSGEPVSYTRKGLKQLRSSVGIVFQDPDTQLFLADVREEISFGILNQEVPEKEAARAVDQMIERLDIGSFVSQPTHALSGGQKKLVSIADILVMDPELVILDEPAAALDPLHSRRVREIVEEMSGRGITVVISTHDMDFAYEWADQVFLMGEGKIRKTGTPQEVFSDRRSLEQSCLKTPTVLEIYRTLTEKFPALGDAEAPRSLAELEALIRSL